MKITKTYLKQLIRETLEEARFYYKPEPLYDPKIEKLYKDIFSWLRGLVSQSGPLEGLSLRQAIQDYPILKDAQDIAGKLVNSIGSDYIDPRDMKETLDHYRERFEKIKQKAALRPEELGGYPR
tara:strand:+ start:361 stop:732 length:372 start_codon:yes stop_codon:yes gene_type:complete